VQRKDILKEKLRGKFAKVVLFLHDNAPAHRALATEKKLAYLCFQRLDHHDPPPTCLLGFAPSVYHPFPGLKKQLKGLRFSTEAEVIAAAETWLEGQFTEFFFEWHVEVRAMG
jgi:hypothetical protein